MRCVWCHDEQRVIYGTVLSGCMCARDNVCDILGANGAYAYKCKYTFRGAISASSFHLHYFTSYFDIIYFEIHHIA